MRLEAEPGDRYSLKVSLKKVGSLYPVLLAQDGSVIDGNHRLKADKSWPSLRLENIDSEEKKLLARLIANFHRRHVTVEEKREWINGLAQLYAQAGLKTEGTRNGRQGPNQIARRIMDVTGIPKPTLNKYLASQFKNQNYQHFGARTGTDAQALAMLEQGKLHMTSEGMFKKLEEPAEQDPGRWVPRLDYYEEFMKEFPHCQCLSCVHRETCPERLRPEDSPVMWAKETV